MIDRYTRAEMGFFWAPEKRFEYMLKVEIAVAEAQAELGIILRKAAQDIKKKSKFQILRILEIEKTTKHDVIAFVSNVAENVGPNGRFIHFGMTSSDVLDTALSLQIQDAGMELSRQFDRMMKVLRNLVKKHATTLCAGRTHGMHAEPTTFGYKLAGFVSEFERAQARYHRALDEIRICKLSGAVGTYSAQGAEVEKKVAKKLKLKCETLATQVIPRDRHADVISSLAFIGSALERLAVELRHLQRTEVAEVVEGFTPGQKGSSAMPHKKNPISAENITGLARLLRAYAQSAMENIPLWHERDISHSSVERVIFADAFIVCDYALHRMEKLLHGLFVNTEQMKHNMDLSRGMLFSSHALLHLVEKGLSREEAYKEVQRISHSLENGEHLKDKLKSDATVGKYFTKKDLEDLFSGRTHLKGIREHLKQLKLS